MRRFFSWMLFLLLAVSCGLRQATLQNAENLQVNKELGSDSAIRVFIQPYHDSLEKTMSLVAGISQNSFQRGRPSSNLGNLMADYCLEWGSDYMSKKFGIPAQLCVLNYGGIRSALPAGEIRVEHMYELMPFENELVVIKLSGRSMDSLLSHIAARGGDPIAGATLHISNSMYSRAMIGELPFDSRRDYYVVTNDYMAEGGDAFSMLKNPLDIYFTGVKVRDILLLKMAEEMKAQGMIKNRADERITESK